MLGKDGHLAMGRIESPSVCKTKTACCRDVKAETTVVIGGGADVVSVGGVGGPRRADGRVVEDQGLCSEGSKRCFPKIKRSVQLVIRRDEGISTRETEEVEREFDLR